VIIATSIATLNFILFTLGAPDPSH